MVFGFYDKFKNRPKIRREPRLKILDRNVMGDLTDAISHKDEPAPETQPQEAATPPPPPPPAETPPPNETRQPEQQPQPVCVGDSCALPLPIKEEKKTRET